MQYVDVTYMCKRILCSHREEWNYVIWRKMDGSGNTVRLDWERQMSCFLSFTSSRPKKKNGMSVDKETVLGWVWGGEWKERKKQGEYDQGTSLTCMKIE
jgi:hypothetical protein